MRQLQIILLASLAACGSASADTVDLCRVALGNGRQITATLGSQKLNVFAGRLIHQAANGTGSLSSLPSEIVTFCAEILQNQADAPSPYTVGPVAQLSGNTGLTNLGFAKQQAIYDLYAAAAGRQFTLGLDYACAFQIAVWEVVYDYNTAPRSGPSLDINGGNFRAASPDGTALSTSITDKVSFLLGSIGSNSVGAGIVGLRNSAFQDQLYDGGADGPVVPLPQGAWMGIGGLALAGLARLRRRS